MKIIVIFIILATLISCKGKQQEIKASDSSIEILVSSGPQDSDVNYCDTETVELFSIAMESCEALESRDELESCRVNIHSLRDYHKESEECFAKTDNAQATLKERFFIEMDKFFERVLIDRGNFQSGRCGSFILSEFNQIVAELEIWEQTRESDSVIYLIEKFESRYPEINCQTLRGKHFVDINWELIDGIKYRIENKR